MSHEAKLSTEVGVPTGASFIADPETGEPLFRFAVDASNIIGPRPATPRDQAEYPGEWKAFEAARAKDDHPIGTDRDGDGHQGGGLKGTGGKPRAKATASKAAKP